MSNFTQNPDGLHTYYSAKLLDKVLSKFSFEQDCNKLDVGVGAGLLGNELTGIFKFDWNRSVARNASRSEQEGNL